MPTIVNANETPMLGIGSGIETVTIVRPCLGFLEVGITLRYARAAASDYHIRVAARPMIMNHVDNHLVFTCSVKSEIMYLNQ